jgi:hypothetical protein
MLLLFSAEFTNSPLLALFKHLIPQCKETFLILEIKFLIKAPRAIHNIYEVFFIQIYDQRIDKTKKFQSMTRFRKSEL